MHNEIILNHSRQTVTKFVQDGAGENALRGPENAPQAALPRMLSRIHGMVISRTDYAIKRQVGCSRCEGEQAATRTQINRAEFHAKPKNRIRKTLSWRDQMLKTSTSIAVKFSQNFSLGASRAKLIPLGVPFFGHFQNGAPRNPEAESADRAVCERTSGVACKEKGSL